MPPLPCFSLSDFLFRSTSAATAGVVCFFSLASREEEKSEPTEREKEKATPWLASAWQKSMHPT